MFIKFLIVIFIVFIAYLLFSTSTFQEGMKKGKKKLKIGKKGGLKKRAKKTKKKVVDAVDDAVDDAVEEGEDAVDDAKDDAGNRLAKIPELPRLFNDLRLRVDNIGIQVESLLAEKTTIAGSAMEEEEDNTDLGLE